MEAQIGLLELAGFRDSTVSCTVDDAPVLESDPIEESVGMLEDDKLRFVEERGVTSGEPMSPAAEGCGDCRVWSPNMSVFTCSVLGFGLL